MASCRTSIVSILNNDDHPSFAVPSKQPKQLPTPLYQYQSNQHHYYQQQQQHHHHHQLQPDLAHRYPIYPDSVPIHAPRILRHPYDPIPSTGSSLPTSPVLSDCSQEYISNRNSLPSYHPYSRHDYPYSPPAILPLQNRLSVPYPIDPPSPQQSLGGATRERSGSRSSRKNKYPCPYAVSHGCTATFTTSGHAARHGKKHTGEKSVHCPICNKAFTRKDNMKQHIRTHRTHSEEMSLSATTSTSASSTTTATAAERDDDPRLWMPRPDQLYGHQDRRSMGQPQTNRSSFHSVTGILSASSQNNSRGRLPILND